MEHHVDAYSAPILESLHHESLESRRTSHIIKNVESITLGDCHPALKDIFTVRSHGLWSVLVNHALQLERDVLQSLWKNFMIMNCSPNMSFLDDSFRTIPEVSNDGVGGTVLSSHPQENNFCTGSEFLFMATCALAQLAMNKNSDPALVYPSTLFSHWLWLSSLQYSGTTMPECDLVTRVPPMIYLTDILTYIDRPSTHRPSQRWPAFNSSANSLPPRLTVTASFCSTSRQTLLETLFQQQLYWCLLMIDVTMVIN